MTLDHSTFTTIDRWKAAGTSSKYSFFFMVLYLFLEFARPQESFTQLSVLRLPAVTFLLLCMCVMTTNKPILSRPQTKLFLFLVFFMVFHTPLAANNYWAYYTAQGMIMTFVAYLAITLFVDSFQKIRVFVALFILVHIYMAIMGIMRGGKGAGGFVGDENDFCLVLNMIIPFAYFMMTLKSDWKNRIFYCGTTLIFLLAIMTTFSRGGFLGLIAVAMYCWLRSSKKILSLVSVVVVALILLNYGPSGYITEIETISKEWSGEVEDGTGGDRTYQWRIGWEMFLSNPIFGVGQQNFPWRFGEFEGDRTYAGRSRSGRAAHSIYFTLMPELGLVGVFIFLAMLFHIKSDLSLIRRSVIKRKEIESTDNLDVLYALACATEASLIAFLVTGIFISALYYPCFWILMGIAVALRQVTVLTEINNTKPLLST